MLIQSYCPYQDWHEQIENSYDKLNYMIKPPLKSEELFMTDYYRFPQSKIGETCMRKVPNGIFPDPNRKRVPIPLPESLLSDDNALTKKQNMANSSVQSYFMK